MFFYLAFAFLRFTRVKCKRKKMENFPFLAFAFAFARVEVVHTCISLRLHLQLRRTCEQGLSTRVFETRTATGSELFSLLTCLHTDTFTFLKPCSHLTLIMLNGSIIQAITIHSILFNYGSVRICENSNTIGRVTSKRETKWRRIAWLPRSSSPCLRRGENQG